MPDLRGTSGSVTFAGSDGPTVANILLWTATWGKSGRTRVTRPGALMHRYSFGPLEGQGTLRVVVENDNATMPIPTGTVATLVLLEDTSPAQSYTFKASLEFLRKLGVDSANGAQQWAEYGWVTNGAATTDTITVA